MFAAPLSLDSNDNKDDADGGWSILKLSFSCELLNVSVDLYVPLSMLALFREILGSSLGKLRYLFSREAGGSSNTQK